MPSNALPGKGHRATLPVPTITPPAAAVATDAASAALPAGFGRWLQRLPHSLAAPCCAPSRSMSSLPSARDWPPDRIGPGPPGVVAVVSPVATASYPKLIDQPPAAAVHTARIPGTSSTADNGSGGTWAPAPVTPGSEYSLVKPRSRSHCSIPHAGSSPHNADHHHAHAGPNRRSAHGSLPNLRKRGRPAVSGRF